MEIITGKLRTRLLNSELLTPFRIMLALTAVIFAVEVFIKFVLAILPSSSTALTVLLDSTTLTLLVLPFIYLLIYRPLLRVLTASKQTEEKYRKLAGTMEANAIAAAIKLNRSESEYRAVLESSPNVIMRIDHTGTIKSVNPAVYGIFGYKAKELPGKNISVLIPGELSHLLVDGFMVSLEERNTETSQHSSEVKAVTKSGRTIPVELTISECVIESSFYYMVIIHDVSERKLWRKTAKEKNELGKREELYRQMFRNNHTVKMLIDPESGLIVDANNAACDFYGFTQQRINSMKLWEIGTLPRKEILKWIKGIKIGEADNSHQTHRLSSGELREVEVHTSTVEVGGKHMFFSTIHDVTERKRAEEKATVHTRSMEDALVRAEDVLKSLSKPPKPIPYFVTSPICKLTHTTGGGDSVRWIDFSEKYAGLYMHDVSGHGIQETLLNILATAAVDGHKLNKSLKTASVPSVFLNSMNSHMLDFCNKSEHFITAVYALMDFEKREIKFSLAGHPAPWLISPIKPARKIGTPGMMLGVFDLEQELNHQFTDTVLKLEPGETLLIYSDGLMEQENRSSVQFEKIFKDDILPQLAGLNTDEAYSILKEEFERHLEGKTPDDDVSFVFIGSRPENEYETVECTVTDSLSSLLKERTIQINPSAKFDDHIRGDRHSKRDERTGFTVIENVDEASAPIVDKMRKAGWSDERIAEVKQVLREMLLNAFMHGNHCSNSIGVKLSHILHKGILEICVADEGRGFESGDLSQLTDDESLMKESGRGLHIIRKFANEIYYNQKGNVIWSLFYPETMGRQVDTDCKTVFSPELEIRSNYLDSLE